MPVSGHIHADPIASGARGHARRRLALQTLGQVASGETSNVIVQNASSTGMLLRTPLDLSEGDRLEVDLPHAGPTLARVVWSSGDLHGCQFAQPISQAALSAAQLQSGSDDADAPEPAKFTPMGDFGSRLRRLRMERDMTLDQVGEALGVSKPTVWAWEQGKARPQEHRIDAIAEVLGTTADALVEKGPDRERDDVVTKARHKIARAYGTSPERVKIMLDL